MRRRRKVALEINFIPFLFPEEMEEYASMSWGEIVEREITHYRKPGDFAQIHEKLLSPSRRRCF